jgi:hypothetical protein
MDASAILSRALRLQETAKLACHRSGFLRANARAERRIVRDMVLRDPARRRARALRGGSAGIDFPEWPGHGLPETKERICPACGDRAVKPNGHVLAVNGLVKAVYLCRACEKPFVFVRAPRN